MQAARSVVTPGPINPPPHDVTSPDCNPDTHPRVILTGPLVTCCWLTQRL